LEAYCAQRLTICARITYIISVYSIYLQEPLSPCRFGDLVWHAPLRAQARKFFYVSYRAAAILARPCGGRCFLGALKRLSGGANGVSPPRIGALERTPIPLSRRSGSPNRPPRATARPSAGRQRIA